jgi:N-acetylglucosaminyl-diphospho-decaprenol L-rhamnosyltransferase
MNRLVGILKADSSLSQTAASLSDVPCRVSVVMVVYRTGPALMSSLQHVLDEPLVDDFVIVDNGSPPEDVALLQAIAAREARVQLLQGHGNIGFARGANRGAKAARGRALVFLNPDAFLQPDCIRNLILATEGQPSPCIVGARVMNENGTEQRGSRRGEVSPLTTILTFSNLTSFVPGLSRFDIHREKQTLPTEPLRVPTISGACFCASRLDFERLSGFDEGYFLHVEDIDLCWRARQMGGSVIFQPFAEVIHLGSTSLTNPVKVEYWKGLGLARYFRKRADNPWRRISATLLSPLILLVSVMRPLSRRFLGRSR